MPEVLSDSPSLQEILWNFCRFKDENRRLTLIENPHFYAELPTSPEAYGDSVKIDPTEDFRHADEFYVLTDNQKPVYIMTDQVLRSFGNVWCPYSTIVLKGLSILFLFFPLFLMSCQTSVGDSLEGAPLRHLSQAQTANVGTVGDPWCLPFQELPGIVVNCSRSSHSGTRG